MIKIWFNPLKIMKNIDIFNDEIVFLILYNLISISPTNNFLFLHWGAISCYAYAYAYISSNLSSIKKDKIYS